MNVVDPNGPVLVATPSNPLPENARAGYFLTSDRIKLRYALFGRTADPARGTVCLIHGRTEYIEKYFETIADFQRRGFAVATFDWRGQGGSERLLRNPRAGHVETFDDFVTDLQSFYRDILLPDSPSPFYLVAHSMGGLVALHAALRDRLMFDRILLSAPMVALYGGRSMRRLALLSDVLSFIGLGGVPLRRRADQPASESNFEGNPLTSDLRRYLRSAEIFRARPELQLTSPTIRWVGAAAHAMAAAGTDTFPERIRVPILMLAAARDTVVSTPAIEQLGLRMRTGRHTLIPNAKHELFMETDAVRAQVLATFDAFITDQSGV